MLRTLAFFVAALAGASVLAQTDCPEFFAAGQRPVITNPKLQPRTREICFKAFAVLHSGLTRTPLYAAEYLTRQTVKNAGKLSRRDSYHAEESLPAGERAELSDYERSGYDRGHLAPNGDFASRKAQAESFSLANMVPQVHENNAGVWAGIESATRQLAVREGELYVVSGPAFVGGSLKKIGNVLVPTHLWKVVYSPAQQRAGAYLVTNDDTRGYAVLTVSALEKMTGVNVLPGLPPHVRDAGMALPKPVAWKGRKNSARAEEEFILLDLATSLIDALRRAGKL
ncbi:MAG: non-specific endonuclease [Polaromonas sp.]|jgi:endonuclease G|nr:non-specific endonuclease [Polaromonas sp.]